MMYIDKNGVIYGEGSGFQDGWREATQAEIDAYLAAQVPLQKWAEIESARQSLTVEFNGNTFAANKESVIAMKNAIDSMGDADVKNWVEDTVIPMTKEELITVFIKANNAYQVLIDAQFAGA